MNTYRYWPYLIFKTNALTTKYVVGCRKYNMSMCIVRNYFLIHVIHINENTFLLSIRDFVFEIQIKAN